MTSKLIAGNSKNKKSLDFAENDIKAARRSWEKYGGDEAPIIEAENVLTQAKAKFKPAPSPRGAKPAVKPKLQPKAKEPWEMTFEEWTNRPEAIRAKAIAQEGGILDKLMETYRERNTKEVVGAHTRGKPVPAEVLKDYPELVKKPKPKVKDPELIRMKEDFELFERDKGAGRNNGYSPPQ